MNSGVRAWRRHPCRPTGRRQGSQPHPPAHPSVPLPPTASNQAKARSHQPLASSSTAATAAATKAPQSTNTHTTGAHRSCCRAGRRRERGRTDGGLRRTSLVNTTRPRAAAKRGKHGCCAAATASLLPRRARTARPHHEDARDCGAVRSQRQGAKPVASQPVVPPVHLATHSPLRPPALPPPPAWPPGLPVHPYGSREVNQRKARGRTGGRTCQNSKHSDRDRRRGGAAVANPLKGRVTWPPSPSPPPT